MILKFLLIIVLINVAKCEQYFQKNEILNITLKQTADFFKTLEAHFAPLNPTKSTLAEIDKKVIEYVKNTTEPILNRKKRELSPAKRADKGINILDGFKRFVDLNVSDVKDLSFFSFQNKAELVLFAAVLKASEISLFQITNNTLYKVSSYSHTNGTRIVSDSFAYNTLLIIQNHDGAVMILRLTRRNEKYVLSRIQDFESYNVTHLMTWRGMNQLYLGVASYSNISIFTWLGEHFDLVQVISIGAEKLIPFYNKGFMHLVATGSATTILRFSLRSNTFIVIQQLPPSQDASVFQLKEEYFAEQFLSLSSDSSVILYKEIHDRFVPFQKIPLGETIESMVTKKAILLLSLYKNTVLIFQYDGWRFVELHAKLYGVRQIRRVYFFREELLLVENEDDTWTLEMPVWIQKKSWKGLQEEMKAWCVQAKNKARRLPKERPELNAPLRILNGHISQLHTRDINKYDLEMLKNISKKYQNLLLKLQEVQSMINHKQAATSFTTLNARKVEVHCKSECRVNRLDVKHHVHPLVKPRMAEDEAKTLKKSNWRCPLVGLPIERVTVKKSINGRWLNELQNNILKVTGDQEVTGEHSFSSLNVTNAFLPLNLVSRSTRKEIHAKEITVKELNLTGGGFLLPLNGPATVTGSIEAGRVKLKGNVNLQGKLTGNAMKHLSPVILISEPMVRSSDCILNNITVESFLSSNDITADDGTSLEDILQNGISLSDNVPVSLTMSNNKTKWNNVTLRRYQNWITANSDSTVIVSGMKCILRDITVTKETYDIIGMPKIETPVCGTKTIAPAIKYSDIRMENVTAQKINSSHVFENFTRQDPSLTLKSFDVFNSRMYRNVSVKNITVRNIDNVDLKALEKLASTWIKPNILRGTIEVMDLTSYRLENPIQFSPIQLPQRIRNMIAKRNIYVGNINNVNFVEFMKNAVKLDDMISLRNITFENGFSSNRTSAVHFPLNLTQLGADISLGKKRISVNLDTNAMYLPYSFAYDINEAASSVYIRGNAIFSMEPTVQRINAIDLEEMSKEMWIVNDSTVFTGNNLYIKNATMKANVALKNLLSTFNSESWSSISHRVLSKSKPQEIAVPASFNNVEVPDIVGANTSVVKSTDLDLNNMLANSLSRTGHQEVRAKWHFNKLNVPGKLNIEATVNNMNLKTDVLRHDTQNNIITGKKSVAELATKDLYGLNFYSWASNALTQKRKKLIILKGRKNFKNVTFGSLNVSGTIMGSRMEKALLKHSDQVISGQKTIQGSINASEVIIDGLVNDVNLTDLIRYQLKKAKSSQRIKTEIAFANTMAILGDIKISGHNQGVQLKEFDKIYAKVDVAFQKIEELSQAAETINTALENRAIYINILQIAKEEDVANVSSEDSNFDKGSWCETENSSFTCNRDRLAELVSTLNSTDIILLKSVLLNNDLFIVAVKADIVSVYLYDDTKKELPCLTDLHVAEIIDAVVEPMTASLWIILQLPFQTLVIHYQPREGFQQYILPATDVFAIDRAPTSQLLLLLSDGVWNLEGLSRPRNIIEMSFKGKIDSFVRGSNYYIRDTQGNNTILMKARYVGN